MQSSDILEYVESNKDLVRISSSTRHPGLYVLKYSKRVFYKDLWDSTLEQLRGAVVDCNYNPVSLPFKKIYNYGIECNSPVFDQNEVLDVYRKVNGFMAGITAHQGQLIVSTTGSLDSKFVDYVLDKIDSTKYFQVLEKYPDLTFMFKCVHYEDPHIIPETEGMYLIGYREKDWNSNVTIDPNFLAEINSQLRLPPVEHYRWTIEEVKERAKTVQHEGYVVYSDSGLSSKVKSDYYLSSKWLARNPRIDKILDLKNDIKMRIPEEFYRLVDKIRENPTTYQQLSEQERLAWIRSNFKNQ